MITRFFLILISLFFIRNLYSLERDSDTVKFTSANGLVILTQNIDSIKYYPGVNKVLNPLSPTNQTYSPLINVYNTAHVSIIIRDAHKNDFAAFTWDSISPGAYRFDWWQYANNVPSGVYYIEKIINNESETYKAIFVK